MTFKKSVSLIPFLFFVTVDGRDVALAGPAVFRSASDISEVRLRQTAEGRYWKRLLHMDRRLFGRDQGEVADKEFYLSPEGKTDPYKELLADIEAFFTNANPVGIKSQPARCAFPERYRYLKSELKFEFPEPECPDFERFKKYLDPQSISVVYASAYINNPTSMFGHTFLKIDSRHSNQADPENGLLSYGLSYGVDARNEPLLAVLLFGVIGGYNGVFSLTPYFEKINEYNDAESRELWEYRLNLNEDELARLTNHLWEMISAHLPYYFFNKNCSSQIMSLLEVVNPEWNLKDHFFYWVIPTDTLRVLNSISGAVAQVKMRPSLYEKLSRKIEGLSEDEKKAFDRDVASDVSLGGNETANVLDALIDFQDYRMMQEKKLLSGQQKKMRREILLARAHTQHGRSSVDALPATPVEVIDQLQNRPDSGHKSEKLSLYGGTQEGEGFLGTVLRPVFHDLLDWDLGYVPNSEIDFLKIDTRYTFLDRRFHLHSVDILEITSLNPMGKLNHGLSWTAQVEVGTPEDRLCHECTLLKIKGGGGYAWRVSEKPKDPILYFLLTAKFDYGGVLKSSYRTGPSGDMGTIIQLPHRIKSHLSAEFSYYPTEPLDDRTSSRLKLEGSWQPAIEGNYNWELRLGMSEVILSTRSWTEFKSQIGWYF